MGLGIGVRRRIGVRVPITVICPVSDRLSIRDRGRGRDAIGVRFTLGHRMGDADISVHAWCSG